MMTDVNESSDVQEETTQPETKAEKSTPSPQPPQTDWKRKYDGLQGAYKAQAKELTKLREEIAALKSENAELRGQIEASSVEASTQTETLQKALKALKAENDELKSKLEAQERRQKMMGLVEEKYPEISDLVSNGLIPGLDSLEEDKWEEYFSKLQERERKRLGKASNDAVNSTLAGIATPPTPSDSGNNIAHPDELIDRLITAGPDEFESLVKRLISSGD